MKIIWTSFKTELAQST